MLKNRIGEISYNKYKSKMTIVEYNKSNDIIIKFDNGYEMKTRYQTFKNGSIKSPYCKTIYEVGFIGEGKYKVSINGIKTEQYLVWMSMISRCYNKKFHIKESTYKDCSVCEEWHNFQNFAKWFDENYYKIKDEKIQLDKDILHKGNKLYSPYNCIFVPSRINNLFIKSDKARGKYPIGVNLHKKCVNYSSRCSVMNSRFEIGYFNTAEKAFYAYKEFKEKYIKQVANEYKDKIPQKLYDAMYNYKVEITD
ncbi:hypothetical protein [Clostridium botulinum]|uniref:hypothetical protein n=1 Tax=Clostridium botulinum TaxID=1491 RepID=UPI001C9BA245|nr:hypothetical protein [Clostridium botulinum]MBY6838715.1 AP2 domain-containing protein [Clostridium botulinum]